MLGWGFAGYRSAKSWNNKTVQVEGDGVTRTEAAEGGPWPLEDLTACALCSQPTFICDGNAECDNSTPLAHADELNDP
jgi:hypothetical protein